MCSKNGHERVEGTQRENHFALNHFVKKIATKRHKMHEDLGALLSLCFLRLFVAIPIPAAKPH
jgi:hypothetical protein